MTETSFRSHNWQKSAKVNSTFLLKIIERINCKSQRTARTLFWSSGTATACITEPKEEQMRRPYSTKYERRARQTHTPTQWHREIGNDTETDSYRERWRQSLRMPGRHAECCGARRPSLAARPAGASCNAGRLRLCGGRPCESHRPTVAD